MNPAQLIVVFDATIMLVSAVWPFVKLDNRNLVTRRKICGQYFPHIARIKSLFEKQLLSGEMKPSMQSAALFNEAAWYV